MYRLIGDSCTDVTDEIFKNTDLNLVPLTIQIDDEIIIDDKNLDTKQLLEKMANCPNAPTSACPAPEAYMNLYGGEEDVYVVTLSAKLSGSYNSASVAKHMYLEENPKKNIAIIDSKSASVGQTLIILKIKELIEQGLSFEEVVEGAEKFRDEMQTKFVLESLENLRKNGRLSNMKALIVNALNIKPIMRSTGEGEIEKMDQARGVKRAIDRLIESVEKDVEHPENRILGITHCNNPERAQYIKEELMKRVPFKDVVVVSTAGISTVYASDGGVIVCY